LGRANQVTQGFRPPSAEATEAARKRAVLATRAVFHYSRFRIALCNWADYERRQARIDRATELEELRMFFDCYSQQFSEDADEAHACWDHMRRAGSTRAQ
jgi:hypothetical protein